MIHKKLLVYKLKKELKLFLCLLLLDLLLMPLVYVNFPVVMEENAHLLFNFYFIYLIFLIIFLVQRQLRFTMKREEKINDYQLPLTKRSLILTKLMVGIITFLIPYLISWLCMGVLMLGRQQAAVYSIFNGTVLLILAALIYVCFCTWVFLRSRSTFQALFMIAVWTLAPAFIISAYTDVMQITAVYHDQLQGFFTLLHDFGCLPGLFTLAAKGLIMDSTFPSLGICLLADGIYLFVAVTAVIQVTKNTAESEHRTLTQSAWFKLMPAVTAASVMIWGSLSAVRPQQCLLSVVLAIMVYLLIHFLSCSKIEIKKGMLLVLTAEFLLVQGISLSWRLSGGWGMTNDISTGEIYFINRCEWKGKMTGYYQYYNVENTATLTGEDKEILVAAQQEAERRYRRQGLKAASGIVVVKYRMQDRNISLRIPYYADIMEPLIKTLEERNMQLSSFISVDYLGWQDYFYLQNLTIKLF